MPKKLDHPWISCDDFKPKEYELCKLLTKKSSVRVGWWTGHGWDGLFLEGNEDILMWKKHVEGQGRRIRKSEED